MQSSVTHRHKVHSIYAVPELLPKRTPEILIRLLHLFPPHADPAPFTRRDIRLIF